MSWNNYGRFPKYISVAERKANIAKKAAKLKKKNKSLLPIVVEGRMLVKTYWGKSWVKNIESYADYAYRLERGRSYVRHGAVLDLKIYSGSVEAIVSGTRNYTVKIIISTVTSELWKKLIRECSGKVNSLIELLQGKLSEHIMTIIAQPGGGLFPKSKEIEFTCSCPDYAYMCKHVAAALYGIGIRLDTSPELLFQLRQVDHAELINKVTDNIDLGSVAMANQNVIDGDLSDIFGVEIAPTPGHKKKQARKKTKKKVAPKKKKSTKRR